MPAFKSLQSSLIAIALLVMVAAGCKQFQSLMRPTVLTSADGKFQLTVPAGWKDQPSLHETASIKAANALQEMYVIVITEEKTDLAEDLTLDRFTDITRTSLMEKVTDVVSSPPIPITINGNAGRQYELQGLVNSVKIAYLITTVETPAHYHQIISWTLRSRIDQNQSTLEKVTKSFRPTVTQAETSTSSPATELSSP